MASLPCLLIFINIRYYVLSDRLLQLTLETWGPYSPVPMSRADAEEAVTNVLGFIATLRRWKKAEEDALERDV